MIAKEKVGELLNDFLSNLNWGYKQILEKQILLLITKEKVGLILTISKIIKQMN